MKLKTTRFGEIEASEDLLFEFISPILGYEDEKEFILIEHKEKSRFKWLQSVKTPDLAFVVTMPGLFGLDYTFELQDEDQEALSIESVEDILAFNIVLIPHENPRASTINLIAPLIFNIKTKKAAQVILVGTNFTVNTPLFDDKKEKEAVC